MSSPISFSICSEDGLVPASIAPLLVVTSVLPNYPRERTRTSAPTELAHRHHDAAERLVHHHRKRCVPRGSGHRQPYESADLDDVRVATGLADPEHDERGCEQHEHQAHSDAHAERGDPHVRGEDAPGDQVETDRVAEVSLARDLVRVELVKRPERQPEGTVRGE